MLFKQLASILLAMLFVVGVNSQQLCAAQAVALGPYSAYVSSKNRLFLRAGMLGLRLVAHSFLNHVRRSSVRHQARVELVLKLVKDVTEAVFVATDPEWLQGNVGQRSALLLRLASSVTRLKDALDVFKIVSNDPEALTQDKRTIFAQIPRAFSLSFEFTADFFSAVLSELTSLNQEDVVVVKTARLMLQLVGRMGAIVALSGEKEFVSAVERVRLDKHLLMQAGSYMCGLAGDTYSTLQSYSALPVVQTVVQNGLPQTNEPPQDAFQLSYGQALLRLIALPPSLWPEELITCRWQEFGAQTWTLLQASRPIADLEQERAELLADIESCVVRRRRGDALQRATEKYRQAIELVNDLHGSDRGAEATIDARIITMTVAELGEARDAAQGALIRLMGHLSKSNVLRVVAEAREDHHQLVQLRVVERRLDVRLVVLKNRWRRIVNRLKALPLAAPAAAGAEVVAPVDHLPEDGIALDDFTTPAGAVAARAYGTFGAPDFNVNGDLTPCTVCYNHTCSLAEYRAVQQQRRVEVWTPLRSWDVTHQEAVTDDRGNEMSDPATGQPRMAPATTTWVRNPCGHTLCKECHNATCNPERPEQQRCKCPTCRAPMVSVP